MNRRAFLTALAAAPLLGAARPRPAVAALPKAKITRVRIYRPPDLNPLFNQSNMVVTVETDIGITGIGEGGAKDTLEQCAGTLIGKNPFHVEAIWQEAYIAWFYPPGREKTHALGALDLALWDIKGKALGLPIHELLGGTARDYCECYATGGARPAGTATAPLSLKERARATMEAGYRAFRMGAGDVPIGGVFDTRTAVRRIEQDCRDVRDGVGPDGNWCIDLHQRFDLNDAVRVCKVMEPFDPFFVEDPVRDEHALMDLPRLRQMTTVPLTHGEEWGLRWDFNRLVEQHDIDFIRSTLPNVGGITELMKVAAICETHAVGIVPHFTGPIATAALVNCLSTYSGPVMLEYNYGGRPIDYLPECLDFRNGKAYTNDRPGLGVTADMSRLTQIGEVTEPGRRNVFRRPDGSLTHW
ncbi:mandelate racemase/muconate lactonizing enzyme family protein [Luteitalea sp.]|uniref:mandelate racemase/muconate lactonizing enzyme family protein n=1 Tax=Luteitalea sp. TaxID=2004800 RepID=UPI0025BEFFAF|nr:mandelate racemase/muconate lactonizing enzyme family protein [Luteitalea sp.]